MSSTADADPAIAYTPSNAETAAPTMQLRWRWVVKPVGGQDGSMQRVRVLEQAWQGLTTGALHWREIPECQ